MIFQIRTQASRPKTLNFAFLLSQEEDLLGQWAGIDNAKRCLSVSVSY